MLLSVITPTHDPSFLDRLQRSLADQIYTNFEWVVVPNGGITFGDLSMVTLPQAKLVGYDGPPKVIGAIKRHAFSQAQGEVLIEVDHDDELAPDALQVLAETFSDPTVDWAFSNCAELRNGEPYLYSPCYGWRWRPVVIRGQALKELLSFPLTPVSLCRIWYAPNHVRAWRRTFYERLGGHDPTRAYLDDQDIVCRSYLAGRGVRIDRCLYIYHYHEGNSCQTIYNADIQKETWNLYDKYLEPMLDRWCKLNGLRKIDLCGQFGAPEGYETVDRQNADIIADLERPWPFESGSVGVFRAYDALEHLSDAIHTMREVHRCLATDGWLRSRTPSTDGRGAFQDPTHRSFWNINSFWYYTRAQQAKYIGTPVRFQEVRLRNVYPSAWHKANQIIYVEADLVKYGPYTPGYRDFPDDVPKSP